MSKIPVVLAALVLLLCAPLLRSQDSSYQPFSRDELDNLLAPIALYPDPLLAQILPAATFPDQVDAAAQFCRAGADPADIDTQPWDVSVKAVAHYPTVLDLMDGDLNWTAALGQAWFNQSGDVMAAIQRLRREALSVGNLATTPQDDVVTQDGCIDIWPAQAGYLYVPVYDPALAFFGSGGVYGGSVVTFSASAPVGVWLNRDIDWRHRRIYYHGWSTGAGWVARSLPYVHVNRVYVNDTLRNVAVNPAAGGRIVNYRNLARYDSVHRNLSYGHQEAVTRSSARVAQRNSNYNTPASDRIIASSAAPASAPAERPEANRFSMYAAPRQSEHSGDAGKSDTHKSGQATHSAPAKPSGGGASHSGGGGGSHSSGGGSPRGGGGGGSRSGGGAKH